MRRIDVDGHFVSVRARAVSLKTIDVSCDD